MLYFSDDGEWIAVAGKGYYAASPGGEQLMGWYVNNGLNAMASYYPASQFRKTFYRPDVIKRLLDSASFDQALAEADAAAGKSTQQVAVAEILPPKIAITSPSSAKVQLTAKTLEVEAVAHSVGSNPITALRVLLDGRPISDGLKSFREPVTGEARETWTVEIPPGTHQLVVEASSAVSKGLSDPIEVVRETATASATAQAAGTLYVLAIGINDYPDKRLKLDCASPDAQALRQVFLIYSRRLFRDVEARLLLDRQATRADILGGLQWLGGKVKAGDVAVVFYAGHGYCSKEGVFYLVPVDAKLRDLSATGISGEALEKSIGELPCTTVLILDACYAASIGAKKRKTRALPVESDTVLRHLIYDCGLVVMCAAYKDQEAAEENGHGFFTQAIVEGLEGRADKYKTGRVEVDDLQTYVKHRVRNCRTTSRSRRSASRRPSGHSRCRNRKRSEAYHMKTSMRQFHHRVFPHCRCIPMKPTSFRTITVLGLASGLFLGLGGSPSSMAVAERAPEQVALTAPPLVRDAPAGRRRFLPPGLATPPRVTD